MKRYTISAYGDKIDEGEEFTIVQRESEEGEWVKWMDAIAEVEEVRAVMQSQLDLLHVKIIKIREVISV